MYLHVLFLPPGRPFFPLSICQLLLILPRQKKPPAEPVSPVAPRWPPQRPEVPSHHTGNCDCPPGLCSLRPSLHTGTRPLLALSRPHLTERGCTPGRVRGKPRSSSLLSPRVPVRGHGSPRQASGGGGEAGRGRPRVAGEGAPSRAGWEEQREGGAPGVGGGRLRNQRGSSQNLRRRGWESGATGEVGKRH